MIAIRSAPDGDSTSTLREGARASAAGAPASARHSPKAGSERGLGPRAFRAGRGREAITVGIVGATGYAGGELVRLLLHHPNVRLAGLQGRNRDNQPIAASHPHLSESGLVIDEAIPEADAIFTALPHGVAAEMAQQIVGRGSALLDVGP